MKLFSIVVSNDVFPFKEEYLSSYLLRLQFIKNDVLLQLSLRYVLCLCFNTAIKFYNTLECKVL